MSCVLEQQIHYRSTKRIFQKMLERADLKTLTLDNFPKFEKSTFADAKLAIAKLETVERIIDFFTVKKINWQVLTDAEIIEKLASIRGIGKLPKAVFKKYCNTNGKILGNTAVERCRDLSKNRKNRRSLKMSNWDFFELKKNTIPPPSVFLRFLFIFSFVFVFANKFFVIKLYVLPNLLKRI